MRWQARLGILVLPHRKIIKNHPKSLRIIRKSPGIIKLVKKIVAAPPPIRHVPGWA
jgi:hypothetical protein